MMRFGVVVGRGLPLAPGSMPGTCWIFIRGVRVTLTLNRFWSGISTTPCT